MRSEDLSVLADWYINSTQRNREAPCYTENGFARKLRRSHKQEKSLKINQNELEGATRSLKARELDTVISLAKLTSKQYLVFQARRRGESFEEIGKRMGVTKQATKKVFDAARFKVKAAWGLNPYHGLHQIYREEVSRSGKVKLQHRIEIANG
ncbi:MAG: hypothetical protein WCO51_00445 [bacterium]